MSSFRLLGWVRCPCPCPYSYSKQSSIAIRPIGLRVTANRLDQRRASPQSKQPSSTSTVSLSTVSLSTASLSTASLSTSTTKSNAGHDQVADRIALTKCEEEILPKPNGPANSADEAVFLPCVRCVPWFDPKLLVVGHRRDFLPQNTRNTRKKRVDPPRSSFRVFSVFRGCARARSDLA